MRNHRQINRVRILSLPAILLLVFTPLCAAQELEEIIVTAQKRSQNIEDVPISITAFSGEELDVLGFTRPFDLFQQTPNVTLVGDTVFPQVNIRGVQAYDFGSGNEAPVGFYFDDVYLGTSSSQQGQLFDIERVEVLRGPQGTLFGRNTTGGLIHYISRKPTAEFEGYGNVQFGTYNQRILEGAISGPLSDRVRARASFRYNKDDGWQDNVLNGAEFAVSDILSGRLLLEADVGEDATLTLNLHGFRQDSKSDGFAVLGIFDADTGERCAGDRILTGDCVTLSGFRHGDPDPTDVYSNLPELQNDIDSHGASATFNWTVNDLDLVSVTAYEWSDKTYEEDADGPDPLVNAFFTVEAEQLSQEFRLAGASEKLEWVLGAFYYKDEKENLGVSIPPLIALLGTTFGLQNEAFLDTDSWAVFGHGEYAINETLSLIGGLRFTSESKDLTISDSFAMPNFIDMESVDTDKVTWKAGINWRSGDDTLTYASISSGFKSSAFNTVLILPGMAAPVGEEENINYEVGWKSDALLEGRARFNAAIFYNDYSDFQVVANQDVGGIPAVVFLNGGDLELYGADLEFQFAATENLFLRFGAGLLEGEMKSPNSVTLRGVPLDGKDPPHAPSLSLNFLVQYFVGLDSGGEVMLQTSATWEDDVFLEPTNDPALGEDANLIWNARVRWSSPDRRFFVEGFVDNILDEELVYAAFDVSSSGFIARIWQPPRRAGVRAGFNFE